MFRLKNAIVVILLLIGACSSKSNLPDVVDHFDSAKYIGTWYEIARFDNRFEKDLTNVYAIYKPRNNKSIKIYNAGLNTKTGKWKDAKGHAKLNYKEPNKGLLRVTFFWPFFVDYRIIYLNKEHTRSIVGSDSFEYLWILSKDRNISRKEKMDLIGMVSKFGYDEKKLMFTLHDEETVPEKNRVTLNAAKKDDL